MTQNQKELTQSELKQLLNYNPDTGVFTWLADVAQRVKTGDVAGCIRDSPAGKSYIKIQVNHVPHSAHRLAFLYMTGSMPINQVDHEDGDGTNNKWLNLRNATNKENACNRRVPSNNTSGVMGVAWIERLHKWRARIRINGKLTHIGMFVDFDDAVTARKSAEVEAGFHENHGQVRPL